MFEPSVRANHQSGEGRCLDKMSTFDKCANRTLGIQQPELILYLNTLQRRFEIACAFCSARRSLSDSCGGNIAVAPPRPTTLGKDSGTLNSGWWLPIGMVRSSRKIISAIRAETIPMPYWLAPCRSMIVMLALLTSFPTFSRRTLSVAPRCRLRLTTRSDNAVFMCLKPGFSCLWP
jgi:hypothetical protein